MQEKRGGNQRSSNEERGARGGGVLKRLKGFVSSSVPLDESLARPN